MDWPSAVGLFMHFAYNFFSEKTGENSYLIPVGGSDSFGLWGYIEGFREIQEQVRMVSKLHRCGEAVCLDACLLPGTA